MNFQMKQPAMSSILRQMLCDCYTDTIRTDFKPDDLKDGNSLKEQGLTEKLVNNCNLKIQPPPKVDT